ANDDDPLAAGENRLALVLRFAAHAPVLLRQIIHGEMDAAELAPRNRQVAPLFGAAGEHHRVIVVDEFCRRPIGTDMGSVWEDPAFRLHLRDTARDDVLLHLEVGNAVREQAAGLGIFLEYMDVMPGTGELLRAGEARRTRADDRDLLSGLH